MTFCSLDFNKTSVIVQRFSSPFFGEKRVNLKKSHIFQLFIFASSSFRFFCFFLLFRMCFKKHMFHAAVGPFGLSLRPNLAITRAREGQSLRCFPVPSQMSLGKKTWHISKNTFFHFSFLRRLFGDFFVFFMLFGLCFKNTCFMQPLGPWACHCGQTLRSPGPGRACFPCSFSKFFFFGLPERHKKTTIFRQVPKSTKSTMKSGQCKWLGDLY